MGHVKQGDLYLLIYVSHPTKALVCCGQEKKIPTTVKTG